MSPTLPIALTWLTLTPPFNLNWYFQIWQSKQQKFPFVGYGEGCVPHDFRTQVDFVNLG